MFVGIADPRLMLDDFRGQRILADFGQRGGDADIRAAFDRTPVGGDEALSLARHFPDPQCLPREQAVKGLAMLGRAAQPLADQIGAATGHVGARCPIQARRPFFGVRRALRDRGEGRLRRRAILLPPRRQPLHPIGQRGEFAAAALRQCGDATGIGIAADRVIDPGDLLPPFGQRIVGQFARLTFDQRFGARRIIGLDQRDHRRRNLGRRRVGPDRTRAHPGRRGIIPDHPLGGGQGGQVDATAQLRQPRQLFGLGQFGRFAEQREQLRQFDPGRPLGEIEFGAGDRVQRPRTHRIERNLGVGPAPVADRGKGGAIATTFLGIELRRNALHRLACGAAIDRAILAGLCQRRNRQGEGGNDNAHVQTVCPPISNCRSFHASALAAGRFSRKRG